MSGLTEQEIMSKHVQSLKEGKDACQWLAKNADPTYLAPRGRHYGNLKRALNALEGSCRQMAGFRGDTRWLPLGIIYAKAMRLAHRDFLRQNWLGFRSMEKLFENGLKRMDDLATAKTGKLGVILPSRPPDWLILPDHKPMGNFRGTMH